MLRPRTTLVPDPSNDSRAPGSPPLTRHAMIKRLLRPVVLAGSLALALLCTGCVIVHFEGDFPDDSWMSDVVHGAHPPAGFDHGNPDVTFVGTLAGKRARLEMEFTCPPGSVDAYFEGVCESIRRVIREDEGTITSIERTGSLERVIRYVDRDDRDERGRVEVEIDDGSGNADLPYQLRIKWHEH